MHADGAHAERPQGAGGRHRLQPAQARPADRAVCRHRARLRRQSRSQPRARCPRPTMPISRTCWSSTPTAKACWPSATTPVLFQFLGRLITGNGGAAIRMRKGSIARIDLDRHPPLLQWLIDPRTARAIYASVAKELPPKDLAEVVRLLAQRPQLQLRARPPRLQLPDKPASDRPSPRPAAHRWRGPGSAPPPAAAAPPPAAHCWCSSAGILRSARSPGCGRLLPR